MCIKDSTKLEQGITKHKMQYFSTVDRLKREIVDPLKITCRYIYRYTILFNLFLCVMENVLLCVPSLGKECIDMASSGSVSKNNSGNENKKPYLPLSQYFKVYRERNKE